MIFSKSSSFSSSSSSTGYIDYEDEDEDEGRRINSPIAAMSGSLREFYASH